MKKNYLLFLFLFILFNITVIAQESIITGKITGSDNIPLQGVSVQVNGTNIQTITDVQGAYSIRVPNNASELIFSYVNMRPVTEKINGRKVIDVQLASESLQLGEVVVVGYGTQKKANLTGAVDQVTLKCWKTVRSQTLPRAFREFCQILISGFLMGNLTSHPGLISGEQPPLGRAEMPWF